MKTYKVTFEIVLKEGKTDFIERAIEEQLEDGEYISEGNIEEVKQVDYTSLEIEDIDHRDAPDYCDAFIGSGYFTDGTPLDDKTLDKLNEDSYLISELIHNRTY